MASLALASEKARSSACGLGARGENLRRAAWKTSSCGKDTGGTQAVCLLRDAEQVCSCSGHLSYLLGGGGAQQEGFKDKTPSCGVELVRFAPVFLSGKCGLLVTQSEIF